MEVISLKMQVYQALQGVCETVVHGYPKDFVQLPLVAWRESANRCYAQADAREHLAELNYTLEIFAGSPQAAVGLLSQADECMRGAGLRRESAAEQLEQDTGICHISARYRALADAAGNVYQ